MISLQETIKVKNGLPAEDLHSLLFCRKLAKKQGKFRKTTVENYPCILENSAGKPVISYKIYGNENGVGNLQENGENSGKYAIPVVTRGKNLLKFFTYGKSVTYNGVTTTIENDGTIIINGKTTGGVWIEIGYKFGIYTDYQYKPILNLPQNAVYTLSAKIVGGSCSTQTRFALGGYIDGTETSTNFPCDFGKKCTFNSENFLFDRLFLSLGNAGVVYDNFKVQLQLESGENATEYEPYHEPVTTGIFLEKPLETGEILEFPEKILVSPDGTEKTVVLTDIPTFSGTTIVETATDTKPSNMKITYKERILK